MQPIKQIVLLALAALLMCSTPVWAANNDDDDDTDEAPVIKTPPKHKNAPQAVARKKDDAKTDTSAKDKGVSGALTCPDTINVAPQELAKTPEGWHAFSDNETTFPLDSIMIYSGEKTLAKMPSTKGTESYSEWMFPDDSKESHYLVCSYFHTSVLLKRLLAPSVKTCRLAFESNTTSPTLPAMMHKIACK